MENLAAHTSTIKYLQIGHNLPSQRCFLQSPQQIWMLLEISIEYPVVPTADSTRSLSTHNNINILFLPEPLHWQQNPFSKFTNFRNKPNNENEYKTFAGSWREETELATEARTFESFAKKWNGKLLTYAGGARKGRQRVLASPQSSWLDDRVPSSEFPKFEVSKRDFHFPFLVGFSHFPRMGLPPIWFSSEQHRSWGAQLSYLDSETKNERPQHGPLIDKKPALAPRLCCGNEIY